MIIMMKE